MNVVTKWTNKFTHLLNIPPSKNVALQNFLIPSLPNPLEQIEEIVVGELVDSVVAGLTGPLLDQTVEFYPILVVSPVEDPHTFQAFFDPSTHRVPSVWVGRSIQSFRGSNTVLHLRDKPQVSTGGSWPLCFVLLNGNPYAVTHF